MGSLMQPCALATPSDGDLQITPGCLIVLSGKSNFAIGENNDASFRV
jgi:hypothetical protein